MKNAALAVVLLLGLATGLRAHTGGEVAMTCPLDGAKFDAWQDFSGTAFGTRLDFRKLGPIPSPWALARCPSCGFPLFKKEFTEGEIKTLKAIVGGERFKREASGVSPYFSLGILREELRLPAMDIAWAYLSASWEVEEKSAADYRKAAERTLRWVDEATHATAPLDSPEDPEVAAYLGIELSRRLGDFAGAERRLATATKLKDTKLEWMEPALAEERRLIKKRDSSPQPMPSRPPKPAK